MVNTSGATVLGVGSHSKALDLGWQTKAWRFYGIPDNTSASALRSNQGAIGEVRFVLGWLAQQVGRVEWHVDIDGKRLDDEDAAILMEKVANEESTVIITTNLVVAGEFNYVALTNDKLEELTGNPRWEALAGPDLAGDEEARWMAVSVVDNNRDELLKDSDLNLRAIWPHPAKPSVADPPLRGVIDVLEEIEQLQDLAYSQNRSRIAQMGILTVASEFDLAVSPSGNFGNDLEQAINTPIVDPRQSSASPILMRGPFELMTGSLSNGARAVQWTKPVQDFDERLESKMKFAIQRLSWGFPVPPEILLGMTATNRAVAFQIEETTYRSHVEPIARMVGRVYAKALKMIMDDGVKVEVTPDPTDLLARRHSVADAKDAYDRGLVRAEWVRRVLGIDEEDAATEDDLDRILLLKSKGGAGREMDPSEVSGNEPVKASASAGIAEVSRALSGAIALAHTTAVSRVGAIARTRLSRAEVTPDLEVDAGAVGNRRLPSLLGPDRLAALEVDIEGAMTDAVEWLCDWWVERLTEETDIPAMEIDESRQRLAAAFADWAATTVTAWPLAPVPDEVIAAGDIVIESADETGGA